MDRDDGWGRGVVAVPPRTDATRQRHGPAPRLPPRTTADPHVWTDQIGLSPCLPHLFRGTTRGFEGSPGVQRHGITPTSSDPGVASVFATQAERFGDAIVEIRPRGALELVRPITGVGSPADARVSIIVKFFVAPDDTSAVLTLQTGPGRTFESLSFGNFDPEEAVSVFSVASPG
ncbi:hypothetical protein [uncultured Streptomyces sp.]|uniref:hypothetical protein n=1 Tax=uncultured Streptomyces sp. TaxID=174707 RepID=UPI00262171E8|nr:hypothetical protein [uncultured Streptomyces sp.]